MRSIWLLVGLLGSDALTGMASADPAPAPPVLAPPSSVRPVPPADLDPPRSMRPLPPQAYVEETEPSYRAHLFVADVAALGLTLTRSNGGILAGTAVYLLDGLVIHGMHDRMGRGLGSLALRAGLPVLGAIVGGAIWWHSQDARCRAGDPDFCSDDEFNVGGLYGFGLGILSAMVLDTAILARPATRKRPAYTWSPNVLATREHVALGITGSF